MSFAYDEKQDVFTIYGIKYAGVYFRAMGFTPPGTWLRVCKRMDNAITVFQVPAPMCDAFDKLSDYNAVRGAL